MPVITRKLEFDAGHRVHNHESKCNHLHGHRYVAEVTVSAPTLDKLGRVIDFSIIKQLVGGWIDEHWDHNILLNQEDPLLEFLRGLIPLRRNKILGGKEPYVFHNGNPTAENMAAELFDVTTNLLEDSNYTFDLGLRVEHVRLYETPNCWADHHRPAKD